MIARTVRCPETVHEFAGGSCQWIEVHELPQEVMRRGADNRHAARWLIASAIIGLLILVTLAIPSFAW